ncbi:unnamed protein product [Rotaria socialis]|uniref:Costars domain-containing protein n=2 Tax=Rotaria socialis TaxID=392032 RepID=A0A818DW71_9BILA|nr:unnamed protein product [Rotaria socialis]CAF3394400.1 unnamed protein product [Rotaria socialis]CAF3450862.1 unnamed protein product [Rotaria socialis]CAF4435309.1 unnamed protein product [Rotaria socialis]CAF4466299.1 unnamed protein product [Rotaria socialis]
MMDTSDKSIEYDKTFVKRPKEKKNHLASRVNKFQEIVNQSGAPPSANQADLAHRGHEVQEYILEEMKQLCQVIQTNGQRQEDGTTMISFGHLFEIFSNISDKLVGILLKARKHGYLKFEGEILLQNRDENVIIQLIRLP